MGDKETFDAKAHSTENYKRGKLAFPRILRIIAVIIPLAVLGNIIYAIAGTGSDIVAKLAGFKLLYLLLAIVLVIIPYGTHSLRILLWSRVFRVKLKPVQAFKTALIADIGSAATPTIIGGGYVKLFFMIGYGFSPAQSTLIMILGTVEDILFFAIALPLVITITQAWNNPHVIIAVKNLISHWPILVTIIAGVSIVLFIYNRFSIKAGKKKSSTGTGQSQGFRQKLISRLSEYKNEFITAIKFVISKGKGTLALAILLAGVGWTLRYASINALILGLGYDVDPVMYTLLHWVVFSTMTLIPTPGAIGGAEVSFALVFSGLLPAGVIPMLTGIWRFATFYMNIAAGAIYLAIVGPGFPDVEKNRG